MELKWLEDFLCLARTSNFSKAAEIRSVTQPAFSRRIKMLELWAGADLFDRGTLPITLTPAGRRFRTIAEDVVFLLNGYCDNVHRESHERQMILRVVALHTLAVTFFPDFYRIVRTYVENISTKVQVLDVDDCLHELCDGACDFFLGYGHADIRVLLDPNDYPSLVIGSDTFLPVSVPGANGQPLHSWPLADGKLSRLVRFDSDCYLGRVQDYLIESRGCASRFEWVYENSVSEGLKAIVMTGVGMGWLPLSAVQRELDTGVLVHAAPLEYATSLEIRLYRCRDQNRPIVDAVWCALADGGLPTTDAKQHGSRARSPASPTIGMSQDDVGRRQAVV